MLDRQSVGIDLPVKALAWEDLEGRVRLTYNSAAWLGKRHELSEQSERAISAIEDGLVMLASDATSAGPNALLAPPS